MEVRLELDAAGALYGAEEAVAVEWAVEELEAAGRALPDWAEVLAEEVAPANASWRARAASCLLLMMLVHMARVWPLASLHCTL